MTRRYVPTVKTTFALALCAGFSTGCRPNDGNETERTPYRSDWEVVADEVFDYRDADGVAQIFKLTVGGREEKDNFANRGDVIVNFDGPEDQILVEFRKFTFAPTKESAEDDFDALSLWAYAGTTNAPKRPQDEEAEDNCVGDGWQHDCEIRVYYDGLSQLRRSGADIRVTLPPSYRHRLEVATQDNVEDDDYFNRGNVCISDLFATAFVETESGNVWVTLADDTYPAPTCSPEQVQKCEDWTNSDGDPAPWAPECDCIAVGGGEFGLLSIDNAADAASNITVDVPADLWTAITAENKGESQEAAGDHCEANVTIPGAEPDDIGNDFPWQAKYSANYPGMPAIMGAGFNIQASSNSCGPVAFTEEPEDFVGVGNGSEQESRQRGNIEICSDCITQTCNELIP